MTNEQPTEPDPITPASDSPPVKTGPPLKLIVTIVLTVCVGAAVLGFGVYFAFNTIKTSVGLVTSELPQAGSDRISNQIAFVGNDFNMWLVKPDGSNLHRLTTDGHAYRFPTWSPDGRWLAFLGRAEASHSVLYISAFDQPKPAIIYDNPSGPPFYLYWSPNSRSLTFLTQEASGLAMRQIEPDTPANQRVLSVGSPFYWAWSPASDKMVLHVGGSRAISPEAHISLLANQKDASREELEQSPGRFQAPAWSSDGAYFYTVAADSQGRDVIYQTDAQTLESRQVTSVSGFSHIVLSPNNRQLAYLQHSRSSNLPFGEAFVVGTDGQGKKQVINTPVASLYWSPDGKKLALLSLTRPNEGPTAKIDGLAAPLAQSAVSLRWWVYNVETDDLQPVFTFQPTTAFLQTVPYFDQYNLSLTFWSPDSRYLVATNALAGQNLLGAVVVIDTTGQTEPLKVGDGTIAVWSWQ